MNIDSFTPISRVKTLNGVYLPAFINNLNFYFTKLQVYEDGLIDAWEMVDLDLFYKKLKSGWVKTAIPDGENISIHHLGSWEVKKGNWHYDQSSFFKHVKEIVRQLNPDMQNLHNCHGQTTKKVGNINKSILGLGNGKPYLMEGPEYSQHAVKGDDFSIFIKQDSDSYALVNLCVFANGSVQVSGLNQKADYSLEELRKAIDEKWLVSEPPLGKKVIIYGLGSFELGECQHAVKIEQLLLDLEDNLRRLQGKKTSSELCRELFEEYCKNPTEGLREQLKSAYESIPEHLRVYVLGDQDRQDIPVLMAIYGEDEIKKWSHYVMAKELGEELPSINVPKPNGK